MTDRVLWCVRVGGDVAHVVPPGTGIFIKKTGFRTGVAACGIATDGGLKPWLDERPGVRRCSRCFKSIQRRQAAEAAGKESDDGK